MAETEAEKIVLFLREKLLDAAQILLDSSLSDYLKKNAYIEVELVQSWCQRRNLPDLIQNTLEENYDRVIAEVNRLKQIYD